MVKLDRTKMEQVFVNIFMNAIHAMPEGGSLTVKTYAKQFKEPGGAVGSRTTDRFRVGQSVLVIEVEDTGPGIPEDKLSQVFDPFFTTKPAGQGTGLGLTVARNIIDLHDGTIEIRNREPHGVHVAIMLKV